MKSSWFILFGAIAISMIGQALLKGGAGAPTIFEQMLDRRTLLGLVLYGSAALLYIVALRDIPMSVALPCTAVSYIAAAGIGYFVFSEPLTLLRIGAIALIGGGVVLLALSSA